MQSAVVRTESDFGLMAAHFIWEGTPIAQTIVDKRISCILTSSFHVSPLTNDPSIQVYESTNADHKHSDEPSFT